MHGVAVGLGPNTTVDEPPVHTDVKVELSTGEVGNVVFNCLSRSPLATSFLPGEQQRGSGDAAVLALMDPMFGDAYAIGMELFELQKKYAYDSPPMASEDHYRAEALALALTFYRDALHAFTYGTNRSVTQVLSDEDKKWLANWPDELAAAWADGLEGAAKQRGAPAVECIEALKNIPEITSEYGNLDYEEENLERELAEIPEAKRASLRKQRLAEIRDRRKQVDKRLKEWLDKAAALERRVKL
jgi:hypothetical protein